LRIELYVGLEDAITAGESNANTIGRRCILPLSFTGRPWYMRKHFLGTMVICAHIGYPDFFITFTCNQIGLKYEKHSINNLDNMRMTCQILQPVSFDNDYRS